MTKYSYTGRTTNIQVCGSNDSGTGNCLNLSGTTDSLGRYVETKDAQNGRTRFWYEANGNVAAIEDAKGVTTKASYNAIGQRTSVDDPNQGVWSFAYNALGEVTGQTDARGIATTYAYDKLGRPTWRTANVDVTADGIAEMVQDHWNYDPVGAKGAVSNYARTIGATTERWTGVTYDSLARPIQTDVVQALSSGTQSYRLRTKYDSYYGRPVGMEYPNGEAVQVLYSAYGHALAEKDPGTGVEYRRTNTVNARGQSTQETFGNGVVLTPQYQQQTGQVTELKYSQGASTLRQLNYGYDVFGNVKRQSLNTSQSREDYSYDSLQRLVSAIRSGQASGTTTYAYDSVGNFTSKSDFSTTAANAYVYSGGTCGGGANAVKSVALNAGGTRTYCYDANGNLTGDNAGLMLQYDHQNMATTAKRGSQQDWFRYGPDGQRTRSWGSDGARVYVPGYEHRTDTGETKVYVGDYAVITTTPGANNTTTRKVEYLLKDRLGSVDAVASSAGAITETRGYDAFGKPRSGTWADLTPPKLGSTAVTPKGFTQHEHLNQLELIHMNGRVFDYNVGRFFGVDPFVQFPLNSQSLNPYSYLMGNPLSGTDPTGYACEGSTEECAKTVNAEGEQKVARQEAGSHIKYTVGTMKSNGDGSYTMTNSSTGKSVIVTGYGGGNGASGLIGSRIQSAIKAAMIASPSGTPNVSGYGNGANSFTTVDGKTATVDVMDFSETNRTLRAVPNPTDAQKAAAIRWAQILDKAHSIIGSDGDEDAKKGATGITYFLEATRGVADRGTMAQALQNRDSNGSFTAKYLQLFREPVSVKNMNGAELMFSVLHEFSHFYASKSTWEKIVADNKSGTRPSEWESERDASKRAFMLMKKSYTKEQLETIQDAGYGRSHIREARNAAGI